MAMNEPKAFASLSSTLLARKGHAKPAMRPQGFAGFGMNTGSGFDDLGWNDMGHESRREPVFSAEIVPITPESAPEIVAEPAERPVVVRQQETLARDLAPRDLAPVAIPIPLPAPTPRAAPGSKGKAAFTLRLDPERHLKLRLVCAVNHRSAQQIVVHALDMFLNTQPDAAVLAATNNSKC
jgi:hypothetical protein